jgi:hypothetical protein
MYADKMNELEAKINNKIGYQEASWLQSMQEHRGILVPGNREGA